ncbi:MFS transporter [Actinokineospora auranticolor]|uniref:MFS transporter n=1 Tax=Actinokineospora auranticolor TaxID=155976 RepID=A0A2S6H0U6_9PSEU|nr:MFS transporter [Actinokineospora auranticolor]PPK71105.1 MFS transporter [Actinokineospora auranticolor]
MGREFGWLWAAFTVSAVGSTVALDSMGLIAILVLGSGTVELALLAAAGRAVGALVAVPLGPWVEFRRKRPVMVAMDLARFAAVASVPAAYALGWLTFTQLVVVAVAVGAANIVFGAASGACLKAVVRPERLLTANRRFEATTWTTTALGPPVGGAAIGLFGPVATTVADAVSYLLSALCVRAMGRAEPTPTPRAGRLTLAEIGVGWRHILRHPYLRPLFLNMTLVNGLIMATAPLFATLFLRELGFTPVHYGLALGLPCLGGLLGARLVKPLVARFGAHRVLRTAGVLRVCWPVGLAFTPPGTAGLLLVLGLQFGLITCISVFNPLCVTVRLEQTDTDRVARVLSAWSISSGLAIAALTVCWGLLASLVGVRQGLFAAGALMFATVPLLPRRSSPAAPGLTRTGQAPDRATPPPTPPRTPRR